MSSPAWSPERFISAYRFASRAHGEQRMPGRDRLTYAVHISMVAMEVCAALTVEPMEGADLAVQCALLHDTIEDTETTYEAVVDAFGEDVGRGVLALTKNSGLVKAEAMRDSLVRIREQPHAVWAVKLADRITNLQPPPEHWSLEKRRLYCEEARTIHEQLGEAHAYLSARLAEKLDHYLERYCTR